MEGYLLSLRNKLYGPLEGYVKADEQEKVLAALQVRPARSHTHTHTSATAWLVC